MKRIIKVGTRESQLAMVQSNWVIQQIRSKFPDFEFELVPIKTKGDMILERLDKIGGKGLFIKELENALIERSIDIAVHSMKDMPADLPRELMIGAVTEREDARDALITLNGKTADELKPGSIVGTCSVRREVQMLQINPSLKIKTLRGNVLTRINKLENGEYDAIILAMAGLKRLGICDERVRCFNTFQMIPAVGQGALAVEMRKDEDLYYLIQSIHHEDTGLVVTAERSYMKKLNGNCTTPLAAYGIIEGTKLKLHGMLAKDDKTEMVREYVEGDKKDAVYLGELLAEKVQKWGK